MTGQVSISLNGRTYRLHCGDGEENRLIELATHVRKKVEGLASEFGQVGDDRLLLMAAVLIADELWDVRDKMAELALVQGDKPQDKSSEKPRSRTKMAKSEPLAAGPTEADLSPELREPSDERKAGAA